MAKSVKRVSRTIERIAGEAQLIVLHDGSKVIDAFFTTLAPVRGFEKLVLGKNPLFVVEATMRICGVCHAAHGIASAEAFENALGVMPPVDGRRLREAIGLLNRVQSHLLQLMLVLPDLVSRKHVVDLLKKCMAMLSMVNDVMMRIGGAPTHPPNITVGGVAKPPTEAGLKESLRKVGELLKSYPRFLERIFAEDYTSNRVEAMKRHSVPNNVELLATHLFYGDRYSVDPSKIAVLRYEKYRGKEGGEVGSTTSEVALYNGRVTEVGPRARLALFREYSDRSIYGLQLARLKEVELSLHRISEVLELIRLTAPVRTMPMVYGYGTGVGVFEAPRGTLLHRVELDDEGRVLNYNIVVPTMFNIPVIERTLIGAPIELAEVIPRIFDPCVPCSTHLVEVS